MILNISDTSAWSCVLISSETCPNYPTLDFLKPVGKKTGNCFASALQKNKTPKHLMRHT